MGAPNLQLALDVVAGRPEWGVRVLGLARTGSGTSRAGSKA
jgi:hypothetical protein